MSFAKRYLKPKNKDTDGKRVYNKPVEARTQTKNDDVLQKVMNKFNARIVSVTKYK